MHGEQRDASGGDDAAWQHNTDGLDSPVRD